MKEGWSGTSRWRQRLSLTRWCEGAPPRWSLEVTFHVTRFGMFRSRAGLALNPWSTAAGPRLAYRHRPYLHTQDVIRTAPPSRSRVKNDYSLLGMLSSGKMRRAFQFHVITGLDPVISSALDEMAGSSPAMTVL